MGGIPANELDEGLVEIATEKNRRNPLHVELLCSSNPMPPVDDPPASTCNQDGRPVFWHLS
jgi:hypothetical protein